MEIPQRKLVFAPFGADTFGNDILLFSHGLLFAMQMMAEIDGSFSFADVHEQLGGTELAERALPPLTESEIRTLAEKAACDAFVDGMLLCTRDPETEELTEVAVALRIFEAAEARFHTPDPFVFKAFAGSEGEQQPVLTGMRAPRPSAGIVPADGLALDLDRYLLLQFRACEELFGALGLDLPETFSLETLRITRDWEAYSLFIKGKRVSRIPETKLGYYEQAIKKDPAFYLALYNSAMLYKTQTDYNTARMRLMRAASVTSEPNLLSDVYFELGLTSIYLGDTKTARNYWERALEYGGDNPSLLVNMAGTYEQEENWNEAKRLNQLVVHKFPNHHKAIVNLGRLHAMFGHLDLAIPLYERALDLQPEDALRHSVLGGCYLAVGRTGEARAQFEEAVRIDPDGDPGKYAAQELDKLPKIDAAGESDAKPQDDETGKKRKRWGLW